MRRALASLGVALVIAAGCGGDRDARVVRFWAIGREGEVVSELVRDFEHMNPGVRVVVQQIPWSAAHEKLLTAFVGGSTPDLAQLGNTWIAEFTALRALEPLDARVHGSAAVQRASYFAGIWDTNIIDGEVYGIPWYVDTRLLFYRKDLLAAAGYDSIPATWDRWLEAMEAVKRASGGKRYAIFLPLNEWAQPVILGLQAGSPLLADHDSRGAFSGPEFRRAFAFYRELFTAGLAPPIGNNEIANMYQEFARGTFAMVVTGPWNLGEFSRRLPPELADAWATAPMPGPNASTPGVSLAGGSSLVLFRRSEQKDAAWRLIEFLSEPAQQARFYALTGDLPARIEAWEDSALAESPRAHAFREQLTRVVPTPKIPEWEQIAMRVQEQAEFAMRGAVPADSALARLDAQVDHILDKRRWLLARAAEQSGR